VCPWPRGSKFALPAGATLPEEPVNPASHAAETALDGSPAASEGPSPTSRRRPFPGCPGSSLRRPRPPQGSPIASVLSMNRNHSRPPCKTLPQEVVHHVIHRGPHAATASSVPTHCRSTKPEPTADLVHRPAPKDMPRSEQLVPASSCHPRPNQVDSQQRTPVRTTPFLRKGLGTRIRSRSASREKELSGVEAAP